MLLDGPDCYNLPMPINRRIVLAERPVGMPKPSDFRLEEVSAAEPGPGECLVRAAYMSVDPYMRGRISGRKSYAESVQIGQTIVGAAVGRVIASNAPERYRRQLCHGKSRMAGVRDRFRSGVATG